MPEDAEFDLRTQASSPGPRTASGAQLDSCAGITIYVLPSGYRSGWKSSRGGPPGGWSARAPTALLCHKPCTVSGGGKSEISKSIADAMIQRRRSSSRTTSATWTRSAEIVKRDFSHRSTAAARPTRGRRDPCSAPERSLGSVIKLLTPYPEYTDEYNAWLQRAAADHPRSWSSRVKRYYRPEWGDDWREHFTVDSINGFPGHELKFDNQQLVTNYLRVGFEPDGSPGASTSCAPTSTPPRRSRWRTTSPPRWCCRASGSAGPADAIPNPSVKLVENCESLLFQRPDDAIHRGFDQQAEADIASPGTFLSNFEPLDREQAQALVDHVIEFDRLHRRP